MSTRVDRSSFRSLITVAAGLTCAAALAIGLTIWWLHAMAIRDAYTNNVNLAVVLAEQTNRSVQAIDIVLNEIERHLESRAAAAPDEFKSLLRRAGTYELLKERLSILSQSQRIWLIDKDGRAVNSTAFFPSAEIDDSDRDYFQHFKDTDDKDLYITQILFDRREGRRLIVFSRRIHGANNEFAGVVAIGVEFNYFESIYKSIASLHEESFVLSHRDGTIIVRYPDSKTHTGEKIPPGAAWYRVAAQGGGEFQTRSIFDGEPRLVAVRLLRDYPLAVNVGVSAAAALATWRIQATAIGIATLLAIFCSGFLLIALNKQFSHLATSEAKRARANAKLARAYTMVDAALNNISHGLVMFDSSARLLVCNQRFHEMYRLSAEVVRPGCKLREILDHRAATDTSYTDDPEQYISELLTALREGNIVPRTNVLVDGRIISVVNHPMPEGGWVSTHDDITEKVEIKAQEMAKTQQLNAALDNMSQGLVMFDSSNRLVVRNQRYVEMYGLSAEQIKPGFTVRELLEHRIAAGNFCADALEQYQTALLAAVKQGTTFSKLESLRDGRIISIINHPVAGGGWVATHTDVTEEKRAEERISYAAHHDSLTGLPNRALFNEQLEQALKRARRGERLAVLYLDLDHFKRSNDTLGHAIGDKLLKAVADRLRACVRDIDVVARLSGDEFAIIQSSLDRPSDAAELAKRVREEILNPFDLDGHRVVIDVSIGISIAPADALEIDALLKNADIALYEAKNAGRGTYCFYEREMNKNMQTRAQIEQDLRSALANGEFELVYQPVVNLEINKISSFEALLRWRHPERGLVPPKEFIPVAEEMGLIVPLGEWVLRSACAEAANWPDDVQVAVNISPIQLKSKDLVKVIISAIASAGIAAKRVELEITESVLMQNTFDNLATLKALRECGVQFAMDDFGTGYSSLGYLMSFPFHRIKVDRGFVADLADKEEARMIVRAISDLGRSLGIRVTVEGVETKEQLRQVRLLGGTEIQGYLISPPRPAADVQQFFAMMRRDALLTRNSEIALATGGSPHQKNATEHQIGKDLIDRIRFMLKNSSTVSRGPRPLIDKAPTVAVSICATEHDPGVDQRISAAK